MLCVRFQEARTMPSAPSDRNLLFGVLALQMDFINRDALVVALNAWVLDKSRPLGEILVAQGAMQIVQRNLLEPLVDAHLAMHSNDVEKSLAAVYLPTPVVREKHSVADAEVQATLSHLPTPPTPATPGVHPLATTGYPNPSSSIYTPIGPGEPPAPLPIASETNRSGGRRYQVLRPHDKGGIGEVFVALDQELSRQVALKEMQQCHAADTLSRGRFVREAEITGNLEHPGVVPVYGLGQYADGRPFYAMRFIKGETLKDAIARYHRSAEGESRAREFERRTLLTRFVAVCNTLAYAHSRGVIHRDIKPANIMLGRYGETLVVDWGMAKTVTEDGKAADPSVRSVVMPPSAESVETQAGSTMGTPAYMSPEQAAGRLDLLGPASDIYGLGATLYTILTGRPPIEGNNVTELLRKVERGEWRPARQVKADVPPGLEAICSKAMARKPEDRYATALELATDIEHWLADESVSVYRDPIAVRLTRWARKHRTAVAVGAAVLQTVVVVLAVSVFLIARSRSQIERERGQVERERRRAEAVNSFLVRDLLAQADPKLNPVGEKITVRELLDRAAATIGKNSSVTENPEVEGAVRSAIGNTYYGLGLYQRAREELERAVACQDQAPEVPAAERIFTKNRLCWVIYKLGNFDETMAREVLAQARAELGSDHEETVYAADNLATISLGNGNRMGFTLYRENLATQQRVYGPEHPLTIRAALSLADGLMSNQQGDRPGNKEEALETLLSSRDAARKTFGPNDPEGLYFENTLGFLYARMGKFAEARQVLAPLQERFLKVLGPEHIDVALYQENLALAEEGLRHLDAAEALLLKSYALRKKRLGDGHGLTRRAAAYLGRVYLEQGKTDEAVTWLRVLLTAGVVRRGTGIATPGSEPAQNRPELADMNLLGDALSGKAPPNTGAQLLVELHRTLDWLMWGSDWLRVYAKYRYYEAQSRFGGLREERARQNLADAIGFARYTIKVMEANPTTPRGLYDEVRASLKQLEDKEARQRPAP
jgi:tRNA A-37 threonylcarbamoyl transferase component Bud32/tetratricopeptide (TPR) repeat protein